MGWKDNALLGVGAILGAIYTPWHNTLVAAARRRWASLLSRRRQRIGAAGVLAKALLRYYAVRGTTDALYVTQMVGSGRTIALLHDPSVLVPTDIELRRDDFLRCDHSFTRLPVSRSALRYYRRRGAKLFDGEFLYLKDVTFDGDTLVELDVGRFNFYAYASLCRRVQREILSRWRRPVIHDRYLGSFRRGLGTGLRPQAIGCMAALLVEGEDGTHIAVARRSSEVVNGPGMRSLAPVFGFECNAIGTRTSMYGHTFYNFVREYVEEFFDFEELVDMMGSRHVDPDWLFELPHAASVLREAVEDRLILRRTGVVINPNDGIVNIAIVAHFTSPEFFKSLLPAMRPNWETAGDMSVGPIEFVRMDDPRLDKLVADEAIDPSSTFALDLARGYLAGRAVTSPGATSATP